MMEITWKDEYCIGIDEIDKQHMDFVKLMNRFIIIFGSGSHIRLQDRILLEIIKYAEYHFISEEILMLIYKYPNIGIQEKEHKALLGTLQHKCSGLMQGSVNGNEIIKYLYNWFMRHTQQEDRKVAEYIKENSSV